MSGVGVLSGYIQSGDRSISRQELMERAARAAEGLAEVGVGTGDCVAILMRNDLAFFEASFAASLLSGYATPVNWNYTVDEAAYVIRDSGARALVVHADLWHKLRAGGIEDEIDGDQVTVMVVATPPDIAKAYGLDPVICDVATSDLDWDSWIDRPDQPETRTPEPVNSMIYTSGTTGRPKGVRRDPPTAAHSNALALMAERAFDTKPEMRTVICGPMYHSAPNAYSLLSARIGATIFLQARFDAEKLLALIDREKLTHIHLVPTMFVRLLKLPEDVRARYDVSSLEFVIHAAAPCPPDVKQAMIDWWGPVINEYYGSTEASITTFCTSEDSLSHPGTVGRVMEDCELRVFHEDGSPCKPGEIGDIYTKRLTMTDFTYQNRGAEREDMEHEGLLTAGDIGYLDEDGYLFLCDRRKDMVISGGVNIYPAEIESVLVLHPDVADCAVFGIPDDEFGESVMAVVQPRPGSENNSDALKVFLRERIAGLKVPRRIEFQNDLPREDSGKIFKRKLREPYWENAGRSI